jgi:hypothetical protein
MEIKEVVMQGEVDQRMCTHSGLASVCFTINFPPCTALWLPAMALSTTQFYTLYVVNESASAALGATVESN